MPLDGALAGFFLVGPEVAYHDHAHAPEELYLPVAGEGRFWAERSGWRAAGSGEVIVHQPWEWHAMRTCAAPVLIFWMWLGPEGFDDTPLLRPLIGGEVLP